MENSSKEVVRLDTARGFFGFRDGASAKIEYCHGRYTMQFCLPPLQTGFEHSRRFFTMDVLFQYLKPLSQNEFDSILYWRPYQSQYTQWFEGRELYEVRANYDFSFLSKHALLRLGLMKAVFAFTFYFPSTVCKSLSEIVKPTVLFKHAFARL